MTFSDQTLSKDNSENDYHHTDIFNYLSESDICPDKRGVVFGGSDLYYN
jgi:hypothetical protein